jgi:DTW domain-containing protein YfiP
MAHLCITNSLLIEGVDFSANEQLNAMFRDRKIFPLVLYPRKASLNVSILSQEDRAAIVPADRELAIIVLDGTWKTARKMIRLSRNLQNLTYISFDPPRPSRYRLRRQPRAQYYSTLEAIHHIIDLFMADRQERPQDTLLDILDFAVEHQLRYSPK